jgi:CRP-like cAMP-binding protein
MHEGFAVNGLLSLLPAADRQALEAAASRVGLERGSLLYDVGREILHADFPESGLISVATVMSDGSAIEVLTVGREGAVGLMIAGGPMVAFSRAAVQVSGEALRVDGPVLRRLYDERQAFRELFHRYAVRRLCESHQGSGCNALHGLEPRLAKWLLRCHDRVDGDMVELTQEALSEMLGATRPTVNQAVGALERRGLIACGRGRLQVVDRAGLERVACECYRALVEHCASLGFAGICAKAG